MMEDKFFDIDEMMVDYAEMTSFDFNSPSYLKVSEEYTKQPYTFKYGNYDMVDMLKSLFAKVSFEKV